jgi:hypothetical protein
VPHASEVFSRKGKVLNLREDSMLGASVTKLARGQKYFTNRLHSAARQTGFQSGASRYADK